MLTSVLFGFSSRPRGYQISSLRTTAAETWRRRQGERATSSVQPFAHRSAGFSPSLLFLRVFRPSLWPLIYRFYYNTFLHGVLRSILSRIARSPAPAAPSISRPDPAELHLPRPHPSLQSGPASRSPPDPRAAFGYRGRRGLSGALNGLPLLEFPSSRPLTPKQPWSPGKAGILATPALGQLRGSPASTRGVLCKRGVLSEPSSPSLEARPRIGDLMTPPGSRSAIPAERRAGARQPKAGAALAGRAGGASTAPPLRSVPAVPPRGGPSDSAPAAILGSGNCGGGGRGKAEFRALRPGGAWWESTYLHP